MWLGIFAVMLLPPIIFVCYIIYKASDMVFIVRPTKITKIGYRYEVECLIYQGYEKKKKDELFEKRIYHKQFSWKDKETAKNASIIYAQLLDQIVQLHEWGQPTNKDFIHRGFDF